MINLFLPGLTAEEFVARSRGVRDAMGVAKSRYDVFRLTVARWLGLDSNDIDVFAISNHATLARTIDMWYSASVGDFYFRPARLDGLVLTHRDEVPPLKEINWTKSATFNVR